MSKSVHLDMDIQHGWVFAADPQHGQQSKHMHSHQPNQEATLLTSFNVLGISQAQRTCTQSCPKLSCHTGTFWETVSSKGHTWISTVQLTHGSSMNSRQYSHSSLCSQSHKTQTYCTWTFRETVSSKGHTWVRTVKPTIRMNSMTVS